MKATYIISVGNLDQFTTRLEKLNKRAKKLRCQPITYSTTHGYFEHEYRRDSDSTRWIADHVITYDDNNNRQIGNPVDVVERASQSYNGYQATGCVREWLLLTVEGESPKYNGWALIGVLEPVPMDDGNTENLIRAVPGNSVPAEYRDRVGQCDHCHTNRKRTETFVVRHENDETRMVGRNCLKDFLGHTDPHALAQYAALLGELNEFANECSESYGSGGNVRSWTLEHFLKVTGAIIRHDGWVSRGQVYERGGYGTATADNVLLYLCPTVKSFRSHDEQQWLDEIAELLTDPTYETEAESAQEWAVNLDADDNDYLYNCNVIARSNVVDSKKAGLAASILIAWKKAMEREIERQKRASRPESYHIGTIGKRMELTVTVERIISTEGMYGVTGIHKMTDENGNDLTWFASGSATWLDEGATYRVKATPKKHDEYKGRSQTILNRVAVVEKLETVASN